MKNLLAALIAMTLATIAVGSPKDIEFMQSAKYSYTSMADNGDVMQGFECKDGRSFSVYYTNSEQGNRIIVEWSGEGKTQIEARQQPEVLASLRIILCAYLRSTHKNKGAAIDVMAALSLVNEPTLRVQDVEWQGASRG